MFTTRRSTWPRNHLVPCVAELVGSCVPIQSCTSGSSWSKVPLWSIWWTRYPTDFETYSLGNDLIRIFYLSLKPTEWSSSRLWLVSSSCCLPSNLHDDISLQRVDSVSWMRGRTPSLEILSCTSNLQTFFCGRPSGDPAWPGVISGKQ